jgi:AcrR family transcriptional regulator
METEVVPELDPRIRRTRQMLHQALASLLAEKSFEEISVQDIASRSTVNRATFYDHFPDKFALLEDMIGEQFRLLFLARMEGSNGTCREGIRRLVLAVCDFLRELSSRCQKTQRQFEPMLEARIKSIVAQFLLTGMNCRKLPDPDARLRATMASWAICGAALDWSRQRQCTPEELADAVVPLVAPTLLAP